MPGSNEQLSRGTAQRPFGVRFLGWMRSPVPVRTGTETSYRWLLDACVALVLWILGVGIAAACAKSMSFLDPLAYPVGLLIGWFPVGVWIHYCRVSRWTWSAAVLMIASLLIMCAARMGGWVVLPLAFAVLLLVLPLGLMLGKFVLEWLPASGKPE